MGRGPLPVLKPAYDESCVCKAAVSDLPSQGCRLGAALPGDIGAESGQTAEMNLTKVKRTTTSAVLWGSVLWGSVLWGSVLWGVAFSRATVLSAVAPPPVLSAVVSPPVLRLAQ